jgi:GDPmannose 4,6-dehydratase
VRDFVNRSFEEVGIILDRKGQWVDEKWYDRATGSCLVEVDPQYFRPAEVDFLLGDSTKARKELWWTPQYTVQAMCKEMVVSDIKKFKKEEILRENWYSILSQDN